MRAAAIVRLVSLRPCYRVALPTGHAVSLFGTLTSSQSSPIARFCISGNKAKIGLGQIGCGVCLFVDTTARITLWEIHPINAH